MVESWTGQDVLLADVVREQTEICLNVYREDATRVVQDANNERRIAEGGYATRQLEELVQNAVDAARNGGARIEVVLTDECLYVANDGSPFDAHGVRSIMASDMSGKSDDRIGRFGIGFKSVLAISDTPKVLSRSICFGFDHAWAADRLRAEGFQSESYPAMRLAKVLDVAAELRDPHVEDLSSWASTIVVVPLSRDEVSLAHRLAQFRSEFVLFSPHIQEARLRNLAAAASNAELALDLQDRQISQQVGADGFVRLTTGPKAVTTWSFARIEHSPSMAAHQEGGRVAAREKVEIQYALPVPAGSRLGQFWAYFPTRFETTLAGLTNAPWKLSDDRTGLLEGVFNKELLDQLPRLVALAIKPLGESRQGMAALSAYPARGNEPRNWADDYINTRVFAHLSKVPSVPNGLNELCLPKDVSFVEGLENLQWLSWWADVPGAPVQRWLHSLAYKTPESMLKVRRLKSAGSQDRETVGASLATWLESLVAEGDVSSSRSAIGLAARIVADADRLNLGAKSKAVVGEVRKARIILLEDGSLTAPTRGKVFVRIPGQPASDVDFVSPELADMQGVSDELQALGVAVMDRTGELHRLLALVPAVKDDPGKLWRQIWTVLRDLPLDVALRILREDLGDRLEYRVRARTASGRWTLIGMGYLAGRIIPSDARRDRDLLIDPQFHRDDLELLRGAGAVDAPGWISGAPREPWLAKWEAAATHAYVESVKSARIDSSKVDLHAAMQPPWPLEPATQLSDEGKALITDHLLSRPTSSPWTARHTSNSSYGAIKVIAPDVWFLRSYGRLRTAFGLLPSGRVLLASDFVDKDVLPAVEVSTTQATALGLLSSPDDLRESDWRELKRAADGWRDGPADDHRRARFYAWLPGNIEASSLMVRVGMQVMSVAAVNIGVTSDQTVYDSMVDAHIPALLIEDEEDAERFVELWGMAWGQDLLQEEIVAEPSGERGYLTDFFPPLKLRLQMEDADLKLQPVGRLDKMIATPRGQIAKQIPFRRDGDVLMVTAKSAPDRLRQISEALNLGLDARDVQRILEEMESAATDQRRTSVRNAENDDARLVAAVGEAALRRCVPAQALEILESAESAAPEAVAALARAVHGVGVLKQLRHALEENGLQPPREWTGRRMTREWVRSLGFPTDLAGFPSTTRAAVELIDGPAVLNDLHEYQKFVTDKIKALLRGVGPERGLVSLPTGAGKTRVTVEALVRGVTDGDIPVDRPLVWIAQTDELCEQAAETWSYVWRAIGPQAPMRLGRLWSDNEVAEEVGFFQVVIATIDKLRVVSDRPGEESEWLRDPTMVVIDEAHGSTSESYTRVLTWMGRATRGRSGVERRPLIGLSATPFRGNSEDQTSRLVNRYDGNRLDRGAFLREDPYQELQDMGVLAQVVQRELDGATVAFTSEEKSRTEEFGRIPDSVLERVSGDTSRTERVVASIAALPDDWTVLAFAPSVENARVMAALLAHRGISAVSISADTPPAERRFYVQEFKAGRIRVLTNYNVLTQGFDAPKVQAVYVARPTFSPNVYQQMIGRGLRGPRNGGSDEVLIVNVRDNMAMYGERLAFNEFDYLWTRR